MSSSLLKNILVGSLALLLGFMLSLPKLRALLIEDLGESAALEVWNARAPAAANAGGTFLEPKLGVGQLAKPMEVSEAELAEKRVLMISSWAGDCQSGKLEACRHVLESELVADDDPRSEAAFEALHARCDDSKVGAVRDAGFPCEILASLFHGKGDSEFASAFAEQACGKGSASGCLQLAKLERDRAKSSEAALESMKRFCSLRTGSESEVSSMCAALASGSISSADFWSRFASVRVVSATGGTMELDRYMRSKLLY